jgi:hypothetical protein
VLDVITRQAIVGGAVVVVLECAAEAIDVQSVVAQAVGHRLSVGVVDSVFEAMTQALAQHRLQRVVVHHGA